MGGGVYSAGSRTQVSLMPGKHFTAAPQPQPSFHNLGLLLCVPKSSYNVSLQLSRTVCLKPFQH